MSLPDLPQVPPERRATATIVTVGTLGLLCLLALILGVQGLMAPTDQEPAVAVGTTRTAATKTTTSPPAPAPATSASEPATPADQVSFSSPSGNIRCVVSSASARCDIASRSWQPSARPTSCRGAWGQALSVDSRHAGLICAGDSVPSGPGLAYGGRVERGTFTCASTPDGVNCTNDSGQGFTLSRARYSLR